MPGKIRADTKTTNVAPGNDIPTVSKAPEITPAYQRVNPILTDIQQQGQ